MQEKINVVNAGSTERYIAGCPSIHFKQANLNVGREIGKSNLNYEIEITSNGFASFVPFKGLGNAWGNKFGFTFGCGDYSPDEVMFDNGLFAMAAFFRNIKWTPFEKTGGTEGAAEAAGVLAKKIADTLVDIGLDVGRPVFPLCWTIARECDDFDEFAADNLTITITPRIAGSIVDHRRVGAEYYLSPRDVVNALVFYASSLSRPNLTIAEQPVALDEFFSRLGLDTKDYDILTYQASAYGHFVDRWPNFEILDAEARATLFANQHTMDRIEKLLEQRTNMAKAAVEIIQLFDRTHGIPAVGLEAPASSINTTGAPDATGDSIPR